MKLKDSLLYLSASMQALSRFLGDNSQQILMIDWYGLDLAPVVGSRQESGLDSVPVISRQPATQMVGSLRNVNRMHRSPRRQPFLPTCQEGIVTLAETSGRSFRERFRESMLRPKRRLEDVRNCGTDIGVIYVTLDSSQTHQMLTQSTISDKSPHPEPRQKSRVQVLVNLRFIQRAESLQSMDSTTAT